MKTYNQLLIAGMFFLFSFRTNSEKLDFEFADNYCNTIEQQVGIIGEKYNLSPADVLPVVYPECSRFNALSNAFESNVLAYYYIRDGVQGADFSIGYFQMKPSFIEALEGEINTNALFSGVKEYFAYKTENVTEERNARLDRLQSQTWQIEYLCAFVALMQVRYDAEKITIPKLRFIASAYNYGFNKPAKEIVSWSQVRAFPNGIRSGSQNYAYGELATNYKLQHYGHE